MVRRALLILTASERAVFSDQPRSEGDHRTRAHPTGAALLGWAARHYDDWLGRGKAEAVFHSGRVRFSDALPLAEGGAPAYPVAQILMAPKHQSAEKERLSPSVVVGRDPGRDDAIQYEARKDVFVTRAGALVDPTRGGRLRTATDEGRAAKGQLFGFQHLEPERSWAATVEADDGVLDDEDWARLLAAFGKGKLHLGRGANTAYGGGYACAVDEDESRAAALWPVGAVSPKERFVRVWALSDLALLDRFGAPALAPTPAQLGLGRDDEWRFVPGESAVSQRRYAPWNGHLRCRDVERQTVAAGSVFAFRRVKSGGVSEPIGLVGLSREVGLGRVWIAPSMLQVEAGGAPKLDAQESVVFAPPQRNGAVKPEAVTPPWLAAVRRLEPGMKEGAAS